MAIAGIDLGTTNSLIALWTDSGPELVANALGDTLTPSAVSIAEDGAVLVGRAAADRLVTHPDRSVASFKRWMGSSAGARLASRFYRAEELSALVLRSLKEDAEARTGGAIAEAVISVPAYFSDPQRKATLDAARLAGIAVERLVNEPTAAALAHGLDSVEEGRFLILDLGGGTFDVSLLHKFEGVMEVRASAGDSHLGGDDFRDVLVALIAQRHGVDPDKLARTDLARLMREAERIKHALTAQDRAGYEVELGDETRNGEVARAEFEETAQPLLRRLRAPIERTVADARVDPHAIDQIVLVGGATRMPMVRTLAARLFGRFPLAHPRPDHVIALGAAAQAGLKARHAALADVVMTDVCPFTLGVSVRDPSAPDQRTMSPLIERNAVVPISRSGRYYTTADNQAAIVIEVFQGENLRPAQNIKIGELRMPVPLAPAGREGVEVRFTYDVNGALEVEVVGESSGQRERRVFRNEANLSADELDKRFLALAEIKAPPRDQAENRALIARAERLYAESLSAQREHIKRLLSEFEIALADQQLREATILRARFAEDLDGFERNWPTL
jgi:molecular chaperone HscC